MSYQNLLKYKTSHQAIIIKKSGSLQWKKLPKSIAKTLINQISSFPMLMLLLKIHDMIGMSFIWNFKWYFLIEIFIFALMLDLVFYILHRICHHNRWLFKNVHKEHHEWIITMTAGALDMSMPDFFLTIIVPTYTSLLINTSIVSMTIGIILATLFIVFSHCGYHIPYVNTNKHDIHHIYYVYNYSSIWDYALGTSRLK
jgi:sterol desaturase/sphingolipid hydroxylase (fatty acid hydroxylase superfamily)